jgi:hypothetical protein
MWSCDLMQAAGHLCPGSAYPSRLSVDADIPALTLRARDRDRGEPLGSAPPTPPYVRVRIRRFEKLR